MSIREQLEILEKVAKVAALGGIKGTINEKGMRFQASFSTGNKRSQYVYVRPSAKTVKKETVVTIFSPCLKVEKGFLKGIKKDQALDLLRRNENTVFARYGVLNFDDEDLIVASVDHLLDTLDPDELNSYMWYVAFAADGYEKTHGSDSF